MLKCLVSNIHINAALVTQHESSLSSQPLISKRASPGPRRFDVPNPHSQRIEDCQFCRLSTGGRNPFYNRDIAPLAGTEAVFTASCIGCTYYVVVAWVWSFIWHFGLVGVPGRVGQGTGVQGLRAATEE
jgi:hypothetical protein